MLSSQIPNTSVSGIESSLSPYDIQVRLEECLNSLSKSLLYHCRTIWLFTRSDIKTIVIPSTLFASAYTASKVLSSPTSSTTPSSWLLLQTLVSTILWIWINLLPFTIENQRQPDSILEDSVNKPWRPLAAGRLTPRNAVILSIFFYVAAIFTSAAFGATAQCLALIVLGTLYNHFKNGLITRNLLNGCGYICFTYGALRVMTRILLEFKSSNMSHDEKEILPWVLIIGAVVATSIHMLDLPDQIGDRARGRRTIPLVFGDAAARWAVVAAVVFWSICCPFFWRLNVIGCAVPVVLGVSVVGRILCRRTVKEDKKTSLLYNVWIAGLFCLPLLKSLQKI